MEEIMKTTTSRAAEEEGEDAEEALILMPLPSTEMTTRETETIANRAAEAATMIGLLSSANTRSRTNKGMAVIRVEEHLVITTLFSPMELAIGTTTEMARTRRMVESTRTRGK